MSENDAMVISIAATTRRAGGLLRLPHSKEVYFYSIPWPQDFSFPFQNPPHYSSTNVKLVNAFLALEIFKEYVRRENKLYGQGGGGGGGNRRMELKMIGNPNPFESSGESFFGYISEHNNIADFRVQREFSSMISQQLVGDPFRGEWALVGGLEEDIDVQLADMLCREDYSSNGDDYNNMLFMQYGNYSRGVVIGYTTHNISKSDYAVLHTLPLRVPKELLHVSGTSTITDLGQAENKKHFDAAAAAAANMFADRHLPNQRIRYLKTRGVGASAQSGNSSSSMQQHDSVVEVIPGGGDRRYINISRVRHLYENLPLAPVKVVGAVPRLQQGGRHAFL